MILLLACCVCMTAMVTAVQPDTLTETQQVSYWQDDHGGTFTTHCEKQGQLGKA